MVMEVFRFGPEGGWLSEKCGSACWIFFFHQGTEVKKIVSLMNGYVNRKHGGYGNEGNLCDVFIMFRYNAECFFSSVSLKDRQNDEATCVAEGGNEW